MALLPGQSWGNDCPYLWNHCGRSLCDGCTADAEQDAGYDGAPWVRGTDAAHRHRVVRAVAAEPGVEGMEQLMDRGIGWFDH
jgi:hypothetical protein